MSPSPRSSWRAPLTLLLVAMACSGAGAQLFGAGTAAPAAAGSARTGKTRAKAAAASPAAGAVPSRAAKAEPAETTAPAEPAAAAGSASTAADVIPPAVATVAASASTAAPETLAATLPPPAPSSPAPSGTAAPIPTRAPWEQVPTPSPVQHHIPAPRGKLAVRIRTRAAIHLNLQAAPDRPRSSHRRRCPTAHGGSWAHPPADTPSSAFTTSTRGAVNEPAARCRDAPRWASHAAPHSRYRNAAWPLNPSQTRRRRDCGAPR